MSELFIKGLIIGVLVSAPMGPVGILCVQRTLRKGRWHGFSSGLGAALSDVVYAAATSLFMGLVVPFVEAHIQLLELCGTIVIGGFGIYLIRSTPRMNLQKTNEVKSTYLHDFVTSFLFTLSNVFIVFLYIGLFAHFAYVLPRHSWWEILKGLVGIMTGAVGWWFVITYLVSKMRRWFNINSIHGFNRIVGSVILLLVVGKLWYSIFF